MSSSSGSNPDIPQKPDWMGGAPKRKKRPRQQGTAQTPVRRKRKPPPNLIQVHPEDLEDHDPTLWEIIRKDSKHGIPGALVSLVIHIVVLLILALFVVQINRAETDLLFEIGWAPERATSRQTKARGPVDVGAFTVQDNAPKQKAPLKKLEELGGDDGKEENTNSGVSPVDVENMLDNRTPEKQKELMSGFGKLGADRSIENALLWLKRQQGNGGSWSLHDGYPDAGSRTMRTDTGATALSLLAFLGAGHTHKFGEHSETVAKGLDWLMANQRENGNYHDRYELGHQSTFYAHSQAVIAMCEAYALTGDENLKPSLEKGLKFLLDSQNPVQGGWKYRPADELTVGDLSVTGWALMALHTARTAGFEIDHNYFIRAGMFLDTVEEQNGTRYKYMPNDPAERVTAAMTAEGILCRQFLGMKKDDPAMTSAVDWLLSEKNAPNWRDGTRNVYAWYYIAQTLHNLEDENWHDWYQTVAKEMVRAQEKGGSTKKGSDIRGSWNPVEPAGAYHEYAAQAGRLYLTALSVLVLETPFRHKPIYAE